MEPKLPQMHPNRIHAARQSILRAILLQNTIWDRIWTAFGLTNHRKSFQNEAQNAPKSIQNRIHEAPKSSCEPTCSRTRFGIEFGCHLDASWGRPGDLLGTILVSFWRRFLKTVFDTSPKLNFHQFGMHFGFHFGINFAAICKHIPVMAKCTKRCK